MKKLIYKKGFLMKISSWENDGDICRTEELIVETLEEAKAIERMCDILFASDHGNGPGIANEYGESLESYKETITEFISNDEFFKKSDKDPIEIVEEVIEITIGMPLADYSCRVADGILIYEVKGDIYLDLIETK